MTEEVTDAVIAVQTAWSEAFEARDLDRLTSLYADETAFYGSTAAFHSTPDGIRTYFATLPSSYRRSVYAVPQIVRLCADAIAATGEVIFLREEADGSMTELPFRMTHVLVRCGDTWKIATHHASVRPG